MIDHAAARRGLATAMDFPLEPEEREAIDDHLRTCSACRAFDADLRADASWLRDIDLGPVPIAVRANLAIAAEQRGRGGGAGRLLVLVGVGALLIAALGTGVLGVGGQGTTGLGSNRGPDLIDWHTEVVDLQAQEFWIDANGQRFTAQVGDVEVDSDPGNATYRTLEARWMEHGVEMRLNLYFAGDDTSSWIDEIRVYNGKPQPDATWLEEWRGTWFKTPIGGVAAGNLDLSAPGGSLHIGGLLLRSTPFDGVNEPVTGGRPIPQGVEPGDLLRCTGIFQLSPREAETTLLSLGYRLSWRLETTTGPNTGYAEPMANAPEGIIIHLAAVGTEGELIMFVAPFGDPKAVPVPFPDDCPPLPADDAIVVPGPALPTPQPS